MEPRRAKFGIGLLLFIVVFILLAMFDFDGQAATKFVYDGVKSFFDGLGDLN